MLAQEKGRYLVLLAMTITFMAIVGVSISKFENRSIGETQKTKKASEMHFPSLILCPHFINNYSTPGTKNLTEYYLKMSSVKDHVLSIQQQYIKDDGLVLKLDILQNIFHRTFLADLPILSLTKAHMIIIHKCSGNTTCLIWDF